jgi:hypothetical protein
VRCDAAVRADPIAEALSGPMQTNVEVPLRDSEGGCDRRGLFAVDVDAAEDVGVARTKLVEQVARASTWSRSVHRGSVSEIIGVGVGTSNGIGGALAVVIDDRISKEAVEPRARSCRIVHRCRAFGGTREGSLHDVFGIGLRPDAASSERDETRPLPAECF